jgi:hypothetical protein
MINYFIDLILTNGIRAGHVWSLRMYIFFSIVIFGLLYLWPIWFCSHDDMIGFMYCFMILKNKRLFILRFLMDVMKYCKKKNVWIQDAVFWILLLFMTWNDKFVSCYFLCGWLQVYYIYIWYVCKLICIFLFRFYWYMAFSQHIHHVWFELFYSKYG